jgi:AcrR family transcriptional regulator
MKSKRLPPSDRKAALLAAALALAERGHYTSVTRSQIAERVGVSAALVSFYLGTMPAMRRLLMRHAVTSGNLAVIGQGLSQGDKWAKRAAPSIRAAAAARLAG